MSAPAEPRLSYEDIARMIEHPVLAPELSEEEIHTGCEIARQYRIAAVVVRPSDADLAVNWMRGSGVAVGSVVSYPHGSASTSVKLYATRDLVRRGVTEIDTVINIGKMISRQFQYVEMELQQMAAACHEGGAILKVAFENGYLTEDLKTIACKIVKRAEVDYARTSTPFGPTPYSLTDVALMKRLLGDRVKIKASGGVRTIRDVLELREAGCARVGTITTVAILEDWKAKLALQNSQTQTS
ncbi:MAG TPA: deoxyribose-phosphate aldolase [Bryobacteraceae bacterium]|jgi:deoxyribose-phosphate aldolase|nr:deoxyribose-phosphate aldolase [Bryobacteraceae bacterium]